MPVLYKHGENQNKKMQNISLYAFQSFVGNIFFLLGLYQFGDYFKIVTGNPKLGTLETALNLINREKNSESK